MPNHYKESLLNLYHGLLRHSPLTKGALLPQLHRAYWAARFRSWGEKQDVVTFQTRAEIYEHVVRHKLQPQFDFFEFGVFEGKSLRWWTEHVTGPSCRFFGFDTFTGLPAEWEGYEAGHFNVGGSFPAIADDRVQFIKGLFHETLPGFLDAYERRGQIILHNDSDLYGSTIFVLMQMLPLMKKGDLIIFDELFYVTSEFRALMDALEGFPFSYQVVTGTHGFCVAVIEMM